MNLFTPLAAALRYKTSYKITQQQHWAAKRTVFPKQFLNGFSKTVSFLFCVLTSGTPIRVMLHFEETPFLKPAAVVTFPRRARFSRRRRSAFAYELSKCCSEELKWWKTAVGCRLPQRSGPTHELMKPSGGQYCLCSPLSISTLPTTS